MVYQNTRSLLQKEGLAPKKKLGQNFLIHAHTARHIAALAHLSKEDTVIEVGVGLGALTTPLADYAGTVIGLEADSGIVRHHENSHTLPDNVFVRHQDVLKADFVQLAEENGPLKIVANLPYSISSPFLFRLLDHHDLIDFAVVMVQKEVALRLMAEPGSKEYGGPTVLVASCASVKPLMTVKPDEFHPRPKVDSMVIGLYFRPQPQRVQDLDSFDRKLFRRVVNSSFGQRRKTLLNALYAGNFVKEKARIAACIEQAGINPGIRAERLSLEDFVALTNSMEVTMSTKENKPTSTDAD